MLIDYHMHTPLCKHATGQPWEYVEHALRSGLDEIGFSDHSPMPRGYDEAFRMESHQMESYLASVEEARSHSTHLSVKLGIETDFYAGSEAFVKDLLESYPFDYVIGSVHYIGEWGFDNPELIEGFEARHIENIWREYFDLVACAADTRLFDILAHPDLVKKFGHRPEGDLSRFYTKALDQLRKSGMAIEVSSAGLRKPVKEIYPSRQFLGMAREKGIPIVFASDAHQAAEVGYRFDSLVQWVREAGYDTLTRFSGRQASQVPLG